MIDLFRAEWGKIVGNRWVTGFLLWVFPVGAAAFFLIFAILILLIPSVQENMSAAEPTQWTDGAIGAWSFVSNIIGRMLLLGIISVNFAGEYQWGTWKNILPRTSRAKLLLAKFLALSAAILLAFGLMSFFFGLGNILLAKLLGQPILPPFTANLFRDFGKDYMIQMGLSFISIMLAAGVSALAAMKMRSILGGVMVGLGIAIAEPFAFAALFGLSRLFNQPLIFHLGRLLPFYNLDNASNWILNDKPSIFSVPANDPTRAAYAFTDSLNFSLGILALWAMLLTALILLLFQRQDISE